MSYGLPRIDPIATHDRSNSSMIGKHRFVATFLALLMVLAGIPLLTVQRVQAAPFGTGPETGTFTTTSTIQLPASSPECAALAVKGVPCTLIAETTATVTRKGRPAGGGITPQMAGTTNYVCLYNSCNGGSGDWANPGWSCGQGWVGSSYTRISDPTGYLWWSKVSYRYHGTLCQNVYFDSVDCSDHGGTGFNVSIDWCGNWNNGGGAPYYYADGGDNITVSWLFNGFPVSAGHWQRLGIDIYLNWGNSYG